MKRLIALALGSVALGCAAPPPRVPRAERTIRTVPRAGQTEASLRMYKSYFALEEVAPVADHFTVFYFHIEPGMCEAMVIGHAVALHDCIAGGIPSPPRHVAPIPAALEREAKLALDAMRGHEPGAEHFVVVPRGRYREIVVSEMIVLSRTKQGEEGGGWKGRVHLRADEALTRIDGLGGGFSLTGFGVLDVPRDAARLDVSVPPEIDGQKLLTDRWLHGNFSDASTQEVLDRALAVARDVVHGTPVDTMAPLLDAPLDHTVPTSYDVPANLEISLYARPLRDGEAQPHLALVLPIHTKDANTKGVRVDREGALGARHVHAWATLGTFRPSRAAVRGAAGPYAPCANVGVRDCTPTDGSDMEADLTIHVEDDRGHVFERVYSARGRVVMNGESVVTAFGLELPGTSSPSPEADRLHVSWPGGDGARSVDLYVSAVLHPSSRD